MTPKVLVLTGDGINCETEMAQAFQQVGFQVEVKHLNDLIVQGLDQDKLLKTYSVLALPGGFSFGDDLSSGKVLALKMAYGLKWDLSQYAEKGGLVLGSCNGFQALIRLGVFTKDISITQNQQGKFINTWVKVVPAGSRCVWLKSVGTIDLPIRHGEGRIVISNVNRKGALSKLDRQGNLCLKYENNPNGSEENLAGLCDSTGRIFGLMPHPEAFIRWTAYPEWTSQPNRSGSPGQGLVIFENAFKEAKASG